MIRCDVTEERSESDTTRVRHPGICTEVEKGNERKRDASFVLGLARSGSNSHEITRRAGVRKALRPGPCGEKGWGAGFLPSRGQARTVIEDTPSVTIAVLCDLHLRLFMGLRIRLCRCCFPDGSTKSTCVSIPSTSLRPAQGRKVVDGRSDPKRPDRL